MDINEVMELVKAGYSATEIKAMNEGAKLEEKKEVKDNDVTPKEVNVIDVTAKEKSEVKETEKTDDVNEALKAQISAMSATIESLTTTVKALQENNQKTATIPANDNVPKSAGEVIKGFIENM